MAFAYSSSVTVDRTKVLGTQSNFPVLLSYTDRRFKTVGNGGRVQNANGYDIRPFSDSGLSSTLTFELERYNASNGEVVMWVKVPSITSASDTIIYLGYGDAAVSTNGSSNSAWDANFLGVYHLKDGTTLSLTSSTGAPTIGNNNGVTATTGQIDGAANFVSSSNQYLEEPGSAFIPPAITWTAWIKAASLPGAYNCIIGRGFSSTHHLELEVKNNGKLRCMIVTSVTLQYDGTGSNTLSAGTFYHLALTYDSTTGLIGYVNGAVDGTVTANGTATTFAAATCIGRRRTTDPNVYNWDGVIDEVRCSNVARSQNWLTTEYNNGNSPSTFAILDPTSGMGALSMRRQGDRNLFGGDRCIMDRGYGPNRRGDRGQR